MTQIATVERILDADHAEISVPRKSACGHDCEECAGCGVTGAAVHARASNPIGARPGQKVVVESSTKNMLRIVVLVYLIPVVLFLAGYVIMSLLTDSVAAQYAVAAAGFAAGIVFAIFYDRRLPDLQHRPGVLRRCSAMYAPRWRSCLRRRQSGSGGHTAGCATPWGSGTARRPG